MGEECAGPDGEVSLIWRRLSATHRRQEHCPGRVRWAETDFSTKEKGQAMRAWRKAYEKEMQLVCRKSAPVIDLQVIDHVVPWGFELEEVPQLSQCLHPSGSRLLGLVFGVGDFELGGFEASGSPRAHSTSRSRQIRGSTSSIDWRSTMPRSCCCSPLCAFRDQG